MPVTHPGLVTETTTGTRKTNRTNTGAKTMKKNDTPSAAEITRKALDEAKAKHADSVKALEEAVAYAAALSARLDDGDDSVTLDEIEHSERAVKRLTQLSEGQAKRIAKAETDHRNASADLSMADRLVSPLIALPRDWYDTFGMVQKGTPFHFVSAPWQSLASQQGVMSVNGEDRSVVFLSQDSQTKRDPRTGIESGSLILAVPSGTHLPSHAERWTTAAESVGMLIGERERYGSRSLGGRTRIDLVTMADGAEYEVHRIAVLQAMPTVPVITATNLASDAESWAGFLVEQIERRSTMETSYGTSWPLVQDLRLTLREFVPTEEVGGNRVTRRVCASGLVSTPSSLDDLSRHIVTPLVDEWLNGGSYHNGIAAGLGRAVSIDVKIDPMDRGIASVTIDAAFVSTTE